MRKDWRTRRLMRSMGLDRHGEPRHRPSVISQEQDVIAVSWDSVVQLGERTAVIRITEDRRIDSFLLLGWHLFSWTRWRRLRSGCAGRLLEGRQSSPWTRYPDEETALLDLEHADHV